MEQLGLPRYAAHDMDGIRQELSAGAGFVVVEGVASSVEDKALAGRELTRFGDRLGRPLAQNQIGETLVEIADFSDEDAFDDRGYRSPGELTPHTDPPPLIVLLSLRAAREGGINHLVSAETIRQSIRRDRPDLMDVYETGFEYFIPDEVTQGAGFVRPPLPTFAEGEGGLSCLYYRPFVDRVAEARGEPLPERIVDALDTFDSYSTDPELRIEYMLKPGETLVLNNFRVLHARMPYQDWPEKHRRRRLLRLWLDADWLPNPPPQHSGRRDPMAGMR